MEQLHQKEKEIAELRQKESFYFGKFLLGKFGILRHFH